VCRSFDVSDHVDNAAAERKERAVFRATFGAPPPPSLRLLDPAGAVTGRAFSIAAAQQGQRLAWHSFSTLFLGLDTKGSPILVFTIRDHSTPCWGSGAWDDCFVVSGVSAAPEFQACKFIAGVIALLQAAEVRIIVRAKSNCWNWPARWLSNVLPGQLTRLEARNRSAHTRSRKGPSEARL